MDISCTLASACLVFVESCWISWLSDLQRFKTHRGLKHETILSTSVPTQPRRCLKDGWFVSKSLCFSFVSDPFFLPVPTHKSTQWLFHQVWDQVTNKIPRILKRKISKSYWSCHTIGLAVPRLSSPRGSREASKRTSDKKLTDRSGKLLSTRLGVSPRSAHRLRIGGFFSQKTLHWK